MDDMAEDLLRLFNLSLSVQLLYRVERQQFAEAWSMCDASRTLRAENPHGQLLEVVNGPTLVERRQLAFEGLPIPVTPADQYGVEHLLRLLVKMPRLLWDVKEDDSMRTRAASCITALGNFIEAAQFAAPSSTPAKTIWSSYEPAPAHIVRQLDQAPLS
jgi:MRG